MSLTMTEEARTTLLEAMSELGRFDPAHPNHEVLKSVLVLLLNTVSMVRTSLWEDETSAGQGSSANPGAPGPLGRQP